MSTPQLRRLQDLEEQPKHGDTKDLHQAAIVVLIMFSCALLRGICGAHYGFGTALASIRAGGAVSLSVCTCLGWCNSNMVFQWKPLKL